MRLSLIAALVLVLLPLSAAIAEEASPTPLETRAGVHGGFARLVFASVKNGKPVAFTASSDGAELTIRFNAPVAPSLDPIQRGLDTYLSDVALNAEGTVLTAKLKRPIELHQGDDGEAVQYVDLINRPKPVPTEPPIEALIKRTTAPIKLAATAPVQAATKPIPTVPVRVGGHDQYDRMVFDWPKQVKATTSESDGKGTITFDQAVQIDLARLGAALPPALNPIHGSEDGTAITFTLPPGRHLRVMRDANHVALDILAPEHAAKPTSPSPPAKAPPVPPPAPIVVRPPPIPEAAAVAEVKTAPPVAVAEAPHAAAQPEVTGTLGHVTEHPTSNKFQIRYTLIDDGVSLRFEWQQPTAAAVFRRGNAVWIIFDQAQKLDFGDFQAANWPVVTAIAQLPTHSGTALRLNVWAGFNPVVRRAGTSWIVDIKSQAQRPDAPVEAQTHAEGTNTSLIYPVVEPTSPISVIDPDVGDVLVTVPLPQLGQGLDDTSDYPDFRALATAQGLVFRPVADQLVIRSKPAEVEIAAPGGLSLSSESDRQAFRRGVRDSSNLFQLADWQGPLTWNFTQRRQAFQAAIGAAPEASRGNARLDLVKFYFVNGMAAEALGVLGVINHDTPALGEEPTVRAIRGASEEQMGQLDAAKADLGGHNLDDRPDAELWRALLAADHADWAAAAEGWAKGKSALKTYPPVLRRKIALKLGEATFRAGLKDDAEALANQVLANDPLPGQRDLATVLLGRIAGERGDSKKAMALWSQTANSLEPDLGRQQAIYALTITKYEQGEMARPDAIAALDRLRFTWRGDDFEALVLRKLADLYVADNDYRAAFQVLQKIITTFPDTPLAREVAAQMQQYFTDLFLGKAADNVPPLKALAFYEEFKELTPAGPSGDAIIRKLADRLVAVDLLDRAAALLENQVKTRLAGLDQARVATQLALVRLLDRKPNEAIAALDMPVSGELPADLTRQRTELRARATAELGKADEALRILAHDDSPDADRLRADIYWRTHNWSAVAALLSQNLKSPKQDDTVEPEAVGTVINVATALVLGNDRTGLDELRQRYATAMDKTPLKDDFRILAGNVSASGGNFRTVADKVAQLGDLQSFMTLYRQRLAQDKLSAIN
jgi:tetratricopeptide (TPR) repeat protein